MGSLDSDEDTAYKNYLDCTQLGICFHAPPEGRKTEDLEDYNERPMVACEACET
jgi:hypothetical protein